jgi:hypothetical protein
MSQTLFDESKKERILEIFSEILRLDAREKNQSLTAFRRDIGNLVSKLNKAKPNLDLTGHELLQIFKPFYLEAAEETFGPTTKG